MEPESTEPTAEETASGYYDGGPVIDNDEGHETVPESEQE